jgi:3-dehydroquinate synthetase
LQSDEELTIESDFKDLGLPVASPVKVSSLTDVMLKDKKKTGGNLDLILIESIGKAIIYSINVKDLEGLLNDLS